MAVIHVVVSIVVLVLVSCMTSIFVLVFVFFVMITTVVVVIVVVVVVVVVAVDSIERTIMNRRLLFDITSTLKQGFEQYSQLWLRETSYVLDKQSLEEGGKGVQSSGGTGN